MTAAERVVAADRAGISAFRGSFVSAAGPAAELVIRDQRFPMFGWFKKKQGPPATEKIAHQRLGEIFPWPKGWRLTAIDEAVIAVPAAIIGDNEVIASVIHCGEEVRLNLPTEPNPAPDARIMIWLQPGQSAWLSKSCQAVVMPTREGDTGERRFSLVAVAS